MRLAELTDARPPDPCAVLTQRLKAEVSRESTRIHAKRDGKNDRGVAIRRKIQKTKMGNDPEFSRETREMTRKGGEMAAKMHRIRKSEMEKNPRGGSRGFYLAAGVALLTVAFIVWPHGPKEPVYQGKALTRWIDEAHDVGIFEQSDETKAAMNAMGTNAVPFLLKEFARPIRPLRGRVYAWVNSHPFFRIHLRTDEERVRLAGNGLVLLDTNAAPALPMLARYVNDPARGGFVRDIVYSVGDAALPYLTAGSVRRMLWRSATF